MKNIAARRSCGTFRERVQQPAVYLGRRRRRRRLLASRVLAATRRKREPCARSRLPRNRFLHGRAANTRVAASDASDIANYSRTPRHGYTARCTCISRAARTTLVIGDVVHATLESREYADRSSIDETRGTERRRFRARAREEALREIHSS